MNNLSKFINFTEKCPICNNDLKLYMTWVHRMTFKAQPKSIRGKIVYRFEQAICKEDVFGERDYLTLLEDDEDFRVRFNTSKLAEASGKQQLYVFQICNEDGFKENENKNDFHIIAPKACYYRSTPFLEFSINSKNRWTLVTSLKEQRDLPVKSECLSFKKKIKEAEQTYVLDMGYDTKETKFYYYSVTDDERKKVGFRPNRFEKTFPLLSNRPKFNEEDREKLIDRFNSWIIVS